MDVTSSKSKIGHQRYLRGGRFSESLACYAVTKCVEGRKKILAANQPGKIVLNSLDWLRHHNQIKLLAFCVMPDHYHVLFLLTTDDTLSDVMRSVGQHTAKEINKFLGMRGQFWQDGFYDHRCRDIDDILERLAYIENNPVRAGLATEPNLWPYSSAFPANAYLLDRNWFAERY